MASIVTITSATPSVELVGGAGQQVFTVTNISGRPLKVGLRVLCDDPGKETWFTLQGTQERDLGANATDQITIRCQAPENAPAAEIKAHLLVYSLDEPGENFTEGPRVAFKHQPADHGGVHPWLIAILVALVIMLVGGGLTWWLLNRGQGVEVPNLIGMDHQGAINTLRKMNLPYEEVYQQVEEGESNLVIDQEPPPNGQLDPDSEKVTLYISKASKPPEPKPLPEFMPKLTGQPVGKARLTLKKLGLQFSERRVLVEGRRTDYVTRQMPAPGETISRQTRVTLFVAQEGVKVPDLHKRKLSQALSLLQSKGLAPGKISYQVTKDQPAETIYKTVPPANRLVPKGQAVNLVVAAPLPTFRLPTKVMKEIESMQKTRPVIRPFEHHMVPLQPIQPGK